jgi:hypothetical protein
MIGYMTTNQGADIRAALRANKAVLDAAHAEQGELVAQARRAGVEWQAICDDTGHARMTVNRIAMKANRGILPKPGDPKPRKRKKA